MKQLLSAASPRIVAIMAAVAMYLGLYKAGE